MNNLSRLILLALLGLTAPITCFAENTELPSKSTSEKSIQAVLANDLSQHTLAGLPQSTESNTLLFALGEKPAQYGCCKICRIGKACGNSCINRYYNCYQPPGCACDAD